MNRELFALLTVLLIGVLLGFGYIMWLNNRNNVSNTVNNPPQTQTIRH